MCKEYLGVHADEWKSRTERRKQEEQHGYKTMRKGKTRRDEQSGATANNQRNRAVRAEENKRKAGTLK